jgi:ABC-type nitrate/sulfonate/bicarbonate transport system substrate-binding protein
MKGLKIGGVPEHFNLPWRLAIEEGKFSEIGLELHWSDMTGGTGQMIKGLDIGSLDIAVLLTEGITKAILDGLPAKIIQVYVNSPLRWGVHVPVDSTVKSMSDLQNKTFAISRYGSGSHLMALVHANQAGWDASRLKFNVVGDIYGGLWALANHEADAFLWEKFTTHPFVEQGKCKCIGEIVTPWPCFVVAVRNEILENHAEIVKEMCQVVAHRAKQLKEDEQASNTLSWRYHLDKEQVDSWLNETEWNYTTQLDTSSFTGVISILRDLDLITDEGANNALDLLFEKSN